MLTITTYSGPRDSLMHLFSEADDSESEIASYIDLGEVLVARDEQGIVGHVQIGMGEEAGAILAGAVGLGRRHGLPDLSGSATQS